MQLTTRRLWMLFFAALAIRVAYISLLDNRDWANWGDEGGGIALNLLLGKGYTYTYRIYEEFRSFRVPVWPLTLYLTWLVFGFSILAAKLVAAVISSVTCVVVALLGRRLFHDGVGMLAGLVAALFPNFIYWTGTLGSETMAIFLIVLAVYCLSTNDQRPTTNAGILAAGCVSGPAPGGRVGLLPSLVVGRWPLVAAGVCLGLLALTRPVFMPFAVLVAIGILCARRDRIALANAACLLMPFVLLVSLWVVRNWAVHGTFVLASTEGGKTFLECHNPVSFSQTGGAYADWVEDYAERVPFVKERAGRVSEVELDRMMYAAGLQFVKQNPLLYARAFVQRIEYLWRPFPRLRRHELSWMHIAVMAVTWIPLSVLAGYALLRCRLWRQPAHLPILLAVLWVTVSAGLFRGCIRYRAPLEPFVILYAAVGFDLLRRASGRGARRLIQEAVEDARNTFPLRRI